MTPPTDDRFATDDEIPWFSADGRGLELPDQCVGFVVRYWPEGAHGGVGELVIDEHTGGPLVMPARVSLGEFCWRLGARVGRYELAALDERYQPLGLVAVRAITATMAQRSRDDMATEVAACDAAAIAETVRLILAPLLDRVGPLVAGVGFGKGLPS